MSGRKKKPKTTKKPQTPRPTRKAKAAAKATSAPEPNMANGEDSDVRLKSDLFELDFKIPAVPDKKSDEAALPLPRGRGTRSGIYLGPPTDSGIDLDLTSDFELTPGDTKPFVIDPFEHLIAARMTRWQLDESEFGPDLDRAKSLVHTDPDMALAKCRVTLERCLWRFHEKTLGPAGTKPLEQLIRDLGRKSTIPRKIAALADVVRELGNVGAHPIIDDEDLSHREAQIAMLTLVLILEWYERTTNPLADTPEYCI